jgi:predicted amidohydrolase
MLRHPVTWSPGHLVSYFLVIALITTTAQAAPPSLRHGSYLHAAVYSPDGKFLASASNDESVRVWDMATGKQHRRLDLDKEYIRAIAFSPDGRLLATGSKEKIVTLWDIEARKILHRLKGHDGAIHCVAFSPDGKVLASAGVGADIIVWDPKEGKELRRLKAPQKEIHSLVFSPDSKLLAAAGREDFMIALFDTTTWKEARQSRERHGGVATLTFTPDSLKLTSAGTGPIRFWDVATLNEVGRQGVRFDGAFDGIYALAYSFDGKYLVSGGQDKSVRLWELATKEEVLSWKELHDWVYSVSFAPDGRTIAVADHGYSVRLCNATGRAEDDDSDAKRLSAEELTSAWKELCGLEPAKAYRAMWRLADAPEVSVPFLRDEVRKLPPGAPNRVSTLLKDLGGEDFERRQKATRALEQLGRAAETDLKKALAGPLPSLELRRSIERIVEKIDGPIVDPEALRALRITATLERAGTPAARELLAELGKGDVDTWLGREARAATARVAKAPKK